MSHTGALAKALLLACTLAACGAVSLRGGVNACTAPPLKGTPPLKGGQGERHVQLRGGGAARRGGGGGVEIRRPEVDKRGYRHVVLENRMEAILVSDPETHSGAAALCVAVGQLDDPPEVEGLAHFLEHMLFLGTEKYPEESNFDQWCSSCAGYSNAWTSLDNTLYHFIVAHNKLRETLDRFSTFFSCPLLSESGTEREMHAVDSEHNKNLQDDDRREYQVLKATAARDHPISRFGSGNYKSLHDKPIDKGVDVRKALLEFHQGKYSANLMRLCVIGRDSLDEMEGWFREMFAGIKDHNVTALGDREWARQEAFNEEWRGMYVIVPVKERRRLSIMFQGPSVDEEYRTKPQHFLSFVLGHEGPGSLLAILKDLGWATELVAGPGHGLPHESMFSVSVSLTEEGLPNWEKVLQIAFHFLHTVRASDYERRTKLWKEMADIRELNFRYRSKDREDSYSESLAYALNRFPAEDVVCANEVFFDPFTEEVNDRLDQILDNNLNPANMRIHLSCPEAEVPEGALGGGGEWRTCEWYGTKFWAGGLREDVVKDARDWFSHTTGLCCCSKHEEVAKLALPPENKFVPDPAKCTLLSAKEAGVPEELLLVPQAAGALEGQMKAPTLLVDTEITKGWYMYDTSLGQPKATIFMQLSSAMADGSVRGAALLRLLLEVLELVVNELRYMAEEAGLSLDITNYSMSTPCQGLRLFFHGYSQKLPTYVRDLLKALSELTVTDDIFAMAKEKAILDYRNRKFQQPYAHAMLTHHRLLEDPFFTHEERAAAVEGLSAPDLAVFVKEYLEELAIESFVVGNIAQDDAKELLGGVQTLLGTKRHSALPEQKIAKLEDKKIYTHTMSNPDADHVDSAASIYFQVGERSHKTDASLELLCQMLDKAAYTQLRTIEQLGYIVSASVHERWGIIGLRFAVQSVKQPEHIAERTLELIKMFRTQLVEMDQEEFDEHVRSLITKKMEPDRNLESKAARFYYEIATKKFCWDRREKQVEDLKEMTREKLLLVFDKFFSPEGEHKREMRALVIGKEARDAGGRDVEASDKVFVTTAVRGEGGVVHEVGVEEFRTGTERFPEQFEPEKS